MSESVRSLTVFKEYCAKTEARCDHIENFPKAMRDLSDLHYGVHPYAFMLILLGQVSEEQVAFYLTASIEDLAMELSFYLSD